MGTQIQAAELTAGDFGGKEGANDYLTLTRPDLIRDIHRSYLEAGADVVETNSFQASSLKLEEWGLEEATFELNDEAARLARQACDEYETPERPRFVAGSMGPTGMLPSGNDPTLSQHRLRRAGRRLRQQAHGLLAGGVDLLIIETMQDVLETRAAIHGVAPGLRAGRPARADPGPGRARHDRPHAARHRHRRRGHDPRARCGPTSSA